MLGDLVDLHPKNRQRHHDRPEQVERETGDVDVCGQYGISGVRGMAVGCLAC
jgi:hypothetical protein